MVGMCHLNYFQEKKERRNTLRPFQDHHSSVRVREYIWLAARAAPANFDFATENSSNRQFADPNVPWVVQLRWLVLRSFASNLDWTSPSAPNAPPAPSPACVSSLETLPTRAQHPLFCKNKKKWKIVKIIKLTLFIFIVKVSDIREVYILIKRNLKQLPHLLIIIHGIKKVLMNELFFQTYILKCWT